MSHGGKFRIFSKKPFWIAELDSVGNTALRCLVGLQGICFLVALRGQNTYSMFESVNIATTQVVPSMGFLDRLFKSKRPGEGDAMSGEPEALSPPPSVPVRPGAQEAQVPSGPSMPAPTMLIRPRGPGMGTGAAQVLPGTGLSSSGMLRAAAVPQGAAGGTHGGIGTPVQITQRISLRPGGGGPPQGAPQPKPKKETQRFALSPMPTQQPPVEAATGDPQRLILPLGMVLRSLPPEVLGTDLGQLLARPAVAGGTVSVPMDQVLRQLPTGVVQFTFDVLQPQIPAELLQSPDQLATHWDRPIRLPLGEVVSRIPAQAMGRRGATVEQPSEYDSIEAPFRVQPQGPRTRRTSRLSAPVEEPVAPPEPAPVPEIEAAMPVEFPVAEAPPPASDEAMSLGFEPFRKAAAPVGRMPEAQGAGAFTPEMPRSGEMPFAAAVPPIKAPAFPSQPKAGVPVAGAGASQKAPTMGITGQISLMGLERDADIQREPTQRLGKPPPGLIAVRPPSTSSLPVMPEDELRMPAGLVQMAAESAEAAVPEQPGIEKAQAFGGGLSSLASLAAMADSGPIESEEELVPDPKAEAPVVAQRAPAEPPAAEPPAQAGAWWATAPGAEPTKAAEKPAEKGPEESPLADLATQWLAMQQDAPYEPKAPTGAPGPVAAEPKQPVESTAKNWWETPLGEPESAEVGAAEPMGSPEPLAGKPDLSEMKPPAGFGAEAQGAPALPADFPPIFVAKGDTRSEPSEAPQRPMAAEPPAIFAAKATMKPEAAPDFVPPLSAAVPDFRRRAGAPPPKAALPPLVQKPQLSEPVPVAEFTPPGGAPILPLTPKVPPRPTQPPRPPLARRPEPVPTPAPEPAPESEPAPQAFAFPVERAPSPVRPPAPAPQKAIPAPRKPVTLASAGRLGAQGRPKGAAPARETEMMAAPRQRSSIPVPKLRADRMSGLLRAASSWTPRGAISVAARPINPRRILSRWLGLEVEREVPIQQVPALLVNSPHVKGAAIVDEEGMALTSQLPEGVSEQAVGALSSRLFNQLKTAAGEVGSQFSNQAIMTLGRWTVQITFEKPFYLVTLHDSPHFPPAVARRMRKIAGALVRQEFGS